MKTFMLMLSSTVQIGRYAEALKKPLAAAFIGLLLLTVVFGAVEYAGTAVRLNGIMKKGEVIYQKDFPYFKYTADKGLVVDARMPVIVEHESVLYVVDTTDPADKAYNDKYSMEFAKYKQAFFVGNRKLVVKQSEMETRTYDLNMLNSIAPFDKDDVGKKFYYWKYLAALCFPFYLLYFYCAKLISVLIISLIGLVINSSSNYKLSYSALFSASAFALVAPLFIDTVLSLAGISIPAFFLIYYAIAAIYLIIGLKKGHAALSAEIKPE